MHLPYYQKMDDNIPVVMPLDLIAVYQNKEINVQIWLFKILSCLFWNLSIPFPLTNVSSTKTSVRPLS